MINQEVGVSFSQCLLVQNKSREAGLRRGYLSNYSIEDQEDFTVHERDWSQRPLGVHIIDLTFHHAQLLSLVSAEFEVRN